MWAQVCEVRVILEKYLPRRARRNTKNRLDGVFFVYLRALCGYKISRQCDHSLQGLPHSRVISMAEHDSSLDDDDDFELEPVDPEIIKHQQERAKQKTREAEDAVDIDAAYEQGEFGDPVDLEKLKEFRFTERHLLIATAVLAMIMTLFIRLKGCMGLFVSGCVALGVGWWFVLREERRRLAEFAEQREEFAQRQAMRRDIEDGKSVPPLEARRLETLSEAEEQKIAAPAFNFSFSMKELLITFIIAAVMFGLTRILGVDTAALVLGAIALVGLIVQALGVEMPPLVVLGWWLLLVMFILVTLWGAFGSVDASVGAGG